MKIDHLCEEVAQDDEGWDFIVCVCGWKSNPVPGVDVAVDEFVYHVMTASG